MNGVLRFPVTGVGASAGGIEALDGFFRGMPAEPGVAVVVVTHLGPDRESLLHETMARYTALPVQVAADGMQLEINSVYVAPSNVVLGIENGHLRVRAQSTGRRERKPIDIFFSELANDRGELAIGIILSGGDSDGTLGVKAVKERGGLTMAQIADGFGPQHASMPESAIATGLVDFAIPVEQMGAKLAEFARSTYVLDDIAFKTRSAAEQQQLDDARKELYGILRGQLGHDFSGYKTNTFMRRVQRRMQVIHVEAIDAYVEHLKRDPQEVGALFRDLLINVTNFFRDADAFEKLASTVIPKLFEARGADEVVRVWVPGCATGEEVYSLGILLREHMDQLAVVPRVQIFASDIDEHALAVARAAKYPGQLLDSVSPERRDRFFIPDGASYVVAKEVRDLCIFSPHSVIRDPPFSRIDLVSCRNLLIYFGQAVQGQVIPTFHYALRPDGYLFLGTSESVSQFDDLFAPVEKKHRIFRRRSVPASHVRLPLMVSSMRAAHAGELTARRTDVGAVALRQMVDAQVLERFSPPHVLVNRDGDVAYYSARTGKYLEPPAGIPSRQIFTMARKGIRVELRTVFRDAVESGRSVTREGIPVEEDDGRVQMVNVTVEPLGSKPGIEPLFLVLFIDQGAVLSREEALDRAHAAHDGTAAQTERELRDTRERLQSVIEEYETALEELKSSNEELVSVNEEMQSTNEELEASKEELVSLNEELHTVNNELTGKIEALDRANSDLQNLFESTAVATVFLDRHLVIRSFTPAMTEVFNIRPADRGRPITDLASPLHIPHFDSDIARTVTEGEVIERRIDSKDQTINYLVRLSPYRNGDRRPEGVVVTFLNVTGLTHAETRQKVLIAELQHRTRNLLALVESVARQTLPKHASVEAFIARLRALGRLQGLLGKAAGEHIDLADIVHMEIETIAGTDADNITITGPGVPLSLRYVQNVALAIHELATNALKYGALKNSQGQLDIRWRVKNLRQDQSLLLLEWRESGLPVPPDSTKRGYGRQLIEEALAYSLRARAELSFGADGVSCRIEMPFEQKGGLARDDT
ncbi:Protein-glutamate methylesterase/protein-glutamine glutaminase [Paraburkholderia kirstenboschensis]|uniref:CheR family methyltransferase n=1 Tax=Paraburkholderia kirstenboschensis TaxID=1245436 RepID=UPI0019E6E0A6|nr:CheR family methyltransferase [Paraburkholderia kirstenboschensis]CAD6560585.1 Protein-glutamate methylesterase/protein-glutamine glutaminase [Paraburkholderia kirstenboschensis]